MNLETDYFIIIYFPLLALTYCIIYPLITNFELITKTHCKVSIKNKNIFNLF